jgi:Domain of unknown function (DUF4157)
VTTLASPTTIKAAPAGAIHAPEAFGRTPSRLVQRACTCGGVPGFDGECAECRAKRLSRSPLAQITLEIGSPDDEFEREAERVADAVVRDASAAVETAGAPNAAQRSPGAPAEDEERGDWDISGSAGATSGLSGDTRSLMEARLGFDFGRVRIHTDDHAAASARSIGARAYTVGRDVVFGRGQYAPDTTEGRRLLAHELTHVVQQEAAYPLDRHPSIRGRSRARVQRDLAVEPPHPEAVAAPLTPEQVRVAIAYNEYRFKDPWSIRTVRDVFGLAPTPAIVDEELVQTVAQWQAERGLTRDGQIGPATTATIVTELRAEDQRRNALLLLLDNYVTATTTAGPTFSPCREFLWDVDWGTSLRSGFIVQEIFNDGEIRDCGGVAQAVPNTPHFWEAWQVDAHGNVGDGGADRWFRARRNATRGNWRLRSRVYTVLTLDPGAGFVRAGGVPDSNGLLSTTTRPTNLGPSVLDRRAAGEWDCCTAPFFHRAR